MIKLYKTWQIYLLAMLVLVVVLPACKPPRVGFYKDDQIPKDRRNDFHDLNKQLFAAVLSGHEKEVDLMLSSELLAGSYNADKIAYYLKSADYQILNEYYIVHKHDGNQKFKAGSGYHLNYASVAKEMYIAFFLPKGGGDDQHMITVAYAKYSYGWRVDALDVGQYTLNGQTTPQFYRQAKDDYAKGYFSDAVINIELASKCRRPSDFWEYDVEDHMNDFYAKAIETANKKYRFPVVIKAVPTFPKIFRIINQSIPEGTYPAVYYQSQINLKDTTALRKENLAIQKTIENTLPGITKNKKYILYSAFNDLPTPVKYVKSYDVTDRLQ